MHITASTTLEFLEHVHKALDGDGGGPRLLHHPPEDIEGVVQLLGDIGDVHQCLLASAVNIVQLNE